MKKVLVVGFALSLAGMAMGQSIIKRGYVSIPPTRPLFQVAILGNHDLTVDMMTGDNVSVLPGFLLLPIDLTKFATEKYKDFYGMDEDPTTMNLDDRITVIQDVELIKWLCWSKKCDPDNAYAKVAATTEPNSPYVLPFQRGPYDNGNGFYCVVQYIQRGNYNIRRLWGLLFSPPGTTFRLYITYSRVGGTFKADGSTIPTLSYQNFTEWKVRVDTEHMIGLLVFFALIPAGVSEVPKLSAPLGFDLGKLVLYIDKFAGVPKGPLLEIDINNDGVIDPNTPEEVRSAADAVFVFIDLVGRYCVGPDENLGNQYAVPDVPGRVTGDPSGTFGFNYQSSPLFAKTVFNSREEPVCCKLISDIEALAQYLGVPILFPGAGR